MSIIEQIRAYVESRKNTAETIRERDICIDIIDVIDYIQEKSEKPTNPTIQEQPVKDFPVTDKKIADFLATHKPIQVPDKYKTADWLFKEQPVCEGCAMLLNGVCIHPEGKCDKLTEQPASEGLEEEINRTYHDRSVTDTSDIDHNSYENIARHFAQWQKEKDEAEITFAYADGCTYTMDRLRRGAVEGEVMLNAIYPYEPRIVIRYPDCPYQLGDKVRIVIVKED